MDPIATQEKTDAETTDAKSECVTYVIVVHGIGEQRKNETVVNVVNRFAEARRDADQDDNRDVLTLGLASGQTGLSKAPTNDQPWMEFDGIPATPNHNSLGIFLGETASTGDNLRFVDLCWSDIMQDSMPKVVQEVDVWAKGLLGRLLRKHENAIKVKAVGAKVPFWIRRVLFLLVDTLMLVRFCMKFRFKELHDLIFVKFLGDAQQYGEYGRCRGRAVRRFHEMMAKLDAVHQQQEQERGSERKARYVIIAHSLGSIMSFDALLYAHADPGVRGSNKGKWVFSGYLGGEDEKNKPDTDWIWRVQSFVTLGSPIDKYLMLWWLNYRYLLSHNNWFKGKGSQVRTLPCLGPARKSLIDHFNYCDELDPVGHNLDVAKKTKAYKAVFRSKEDIVFNRYSVPGAAHTRYWKDQRLFKWILERAVDRKTEKLSDPPEWFSYKAYRKLLSRIYNWAPRAIVASTFFTVSLALLAESWHTVVPSAAAFGVVVLLGKRLIDLGIWWRQIQRQESNKLWEDLGERGREVAQGLPNATDEQPCEVRKALRKLAQSRERRAKRSRCWIRLTPWLMMAATTVLAWRGFGLITGQNRNIDSGSSLEDLLACISDKIACPSLLQECFPVPVEGWMVKLAIFMLVSASVAFAYGRFLVLPDAYRKPASIRDTYTAERLTACIAVLPVVAGWFLNCFLPVSWSDHVENQNHELFIMGQLTLLSFIATTTYTYRWLRFMIAKKKVWRKRCRAISYDVYANHP